MDPRPLKILIIELGPLGNWVMTTGAFRDIRTHYPNAAVYHLTQTAYSEMARQLGCFDEILAARWEEPFNLKESIEFLSARFVWKRKLQKIGFDIVFDFHASRNVKRAFYGGLSNGSAVFFTKQREYPHMVDVYRDILKEAGMEAISEPFVRCPPLKEDQNRIYFQAKEIPKPFSVLIPRSKLEHHGKNWPLDRYMILARLLKTSGFAPVIVGHACDLKALKPLREMTGTIDLVGKTKLEDLGGIFAKASVVIGVDTGTTHIAAVVGAPTISLYGRPEKVEVWGARGQQVSWIKAKRMNEIAVETVWSECQKFIGHPEQPSTRAVRSTSEGSLLSFPHVRQKARRDSSRRIPPVLWRTFSGNPKSGSPTHFRRRTSRSFRKVLRALSASVTTFPPEDGSAFLVEDGDDNSLQPHNGGGRGVSLGSVNISVVIIAFNEERNIRDCLESVRWADEIIVVDALSSDRTVEIAREYTNKIYERAWEGYSSQKNFGMSQARCEWVLFLDADERISEASALEIQEVIETDSGLFHGYHIPRESFYLGRWIRHGEWNPDLKLRLVRKGRAKWVGKVHERMILSGRRGYLKHPMRHYTYWDIKQHFEKFKRYSSLFAEEVFERGERASWSKIVLKPAFRFFNGYFVRQGFRDGIPGFVIAAMQAFEVFLRYTKLRGLERNANREKSVHSVSESGNFK